MTTEHNDCIKCWMSIRALDENLTRGSLINPNGHSVHSERRMCSRTISRTNNMAVQQIGAPEPHTVLDANTQTAEVLPFIFAGGRGRNSRWRPQLLLAAICKTHIDQSILQLRRDSGVAGRRVRKKSRGLERERARERCGQSAEFTELLLFSSARSSLASSQSF